MPAAAHPEELFSIIISRSESNGTRTLFKKNYLKASNEVFFIKTELDLLFYKSYKGGN